MRDFVKVFFDLLKKLELYQDEPIPNQTKNPASVQNFKKWPVFAAFSVKSSLRAQGGPIQKFGPCRLVCFGALGTAAMSA